MKNIVKIFTVAAVLTVGCVFTSCIKEDAAESLNEVAVTFTTRADQNTASQEQGDGIEDVMIWAFQCDAAGTVLNPDEAAKGWRVVDGLTGLFTAVQIHIELPMCGDTDQKYRCVAVLNRNRFGTITDPAGNALTLGKNTTYNQLVQAKFNADAVMALKPVESDHTPLMMPVSHWIDFTISKTNTHPDHCLAVNMPVYRGVAKASFYMAKPAEGMTLNVNKVTLISASAPVEGALLSSITDVAAATAPDWNTNITLSGAAFSNTLVAETAPVAVDKVLTAHPTIAADASTADYYTPAGTAFIYETKTGSAVDEYETAPTGNGYYMKIEYTYSMTMSTGAVISGNEVRYVVLPAVVRNHDYQVRALVDVKTGSFDLTYKVVDWTKETQIEVGFN